MSDAKVDKAAQWLRDVLATGPVAAKDLKRHADSFGLSWRTIERAKAAAGVVSLRTGNIAAWTLAETIGGTPPNDSANGGAANDSATPPTANLPARRLRDIRDIPAPTPAAKPPAVRLRDMPPAERKRAFTEMKRTVLLELHAEERDQERRSPAAQLYDQVRNLPLRDRRVTTPKGEGRLWQCFKTRVGVLLDSNPTTATYFPPEVVKPLPL